MSSKGFCGNMTAAATQANAALVMSPIMGACNKTYNEPGQGPYRILLDFTRTRTLPELCQNLPELTRTYQNFSRLFPVFTRTYQKLSELFQTLPDLTITATATVLPPLAVAVAVAVDETVPVAVVV